MSVDSSRLTTGWTDDTEAFGWQLKELPEMGYTLVSTRPNGEQGPLEPGFINGGILQRGGQITGPVITNDVDDIDQVLATIEGLGGTRRRPAGNRLRIRAPGPHGADVARVAD